MQSAIFGRRRTWKNPATTSTPSSIRNVTPMLVCSGRKSASASQMRTVWSSPALRRKRRLGAGATAQTSSLWPWSMRTHLPVEASNNSRLWVPPTTTRSAVRKLKQRTRSAPRNLNVGTRRRPTANPRGWRCRATGTGCRGSGSARANLTPLGSSNSSEAGRKSVPSANLPGKYFPCWCTPGDHAAAGAPAGAQARRVPIRPVGSNAAVANLQR